MKCITAGLISIGIGLFFILIWTLLNAGVIIVGGCLLAIIFYWSIEIITKHPKREVMKIKLIKFGVYFMLFVAFMWLVAVGYVFHTMHNLNVAIALLN